MSILYVTRISRDHRYEYKVERMTTTEDKHLVELTRTAGVDLAPVAYAKAGDAKRVCFYSTEELCVFGSVILFLT